jgi:nicotinate-nucleotide pyrophosphorylase (carboxylating)
MNAGSDDPIVDLISLALAEDLGTTGDITSNAFITADSISRTTVVARENCVGSGLATAQEVFLRVDPSLEVSVLCCEGKTLVAGSVLMEVTGSTRSILAAERTVLNFLGRLCGIATLARRYADEIRGMDVQLLDTRKTTPGWRQLEKQAVKAGGCVNHRMGLYDAVLVKDNHLASLGDFSMLPPIIAKLRAEHPGLPIEIEADTLEQVEILLAMASIDVILLDNMPPETMREAVALRAAKAPRVQLEASGGVTLETLRMIAGTGVERISVGALTHSVVSADLSLELHHAD